MTPIAKSCNDYYFSITHTFICPFVSFVFSLACSSLESEGDKFNYFTVCAFVVTIIAQSGYAKYTSSIAKYEVNCRWLVLSLYFFFSLAFFHRIAFLNWLLRCDKNKWPTIEIECVASLPIIPIRDSLHIHAISLAALKPYLLLLIILHT